MDERGFNPSLPSLRCITYLEACYSARYLFFLPTCFFLARHTHTRLRARFSRIERSAVPGYRPGRARSPARDPLRRQLRAGRRRLPRAQRHLGHAGGLALPGATRPAGRLECNEQLGHPAGCGLKLMDNRTRGLGKLSGKGQGGGRGEKRGRRLV